MSTVTNESRDTINGSPSSVEELQEAEESLKVYCMPVELYNILQRRAVGKPLFLQRCLRYKIQEKNKTSLGNGNVVFEFKYYKNMLHKTEVTEDFSCPFCLIRCTSFKGLEWHLNSSHDHFDYECWANEDYPVVVVYPKTDTCTSEIVGNTIDPREEPFFFCQKPLKRRSQNQNANRVRPLALVSYMPGTPSVITGVQEHTECGPYNPNAAGGSGTAGVISARTESDAQTVPESCITLIAPLPFAQRRRLSTELPDPESRTLLVKRCFFHSHSAKPMTLEQVFAEEDSEDEMIDDDIADLERRLTLNDSVDVTQEEKQLMHLWNSFLRKQRVLADGHIPWACEAFSHLHGEDLLHTPQFNRCWVSILIKLWNHGLLDAKTINNCQDIVKRLA